MTLEQAARALSAEWVHPGPAGAATRSLRGVVATDLMSDLLVADRHGHLVLTSLASDQVIRTADIVGAPAVVVVNGKPLPAGMVDLARELGVALLRSTLPMYEACVAVARAAGP